MRDPVQGFPWPSDSALAFCHIKGVEHKDGRMSILNPAEAKLAVDIVQRLLDAGSVDMGGIGVITPYEAQTNLIQKKLVESLWHLWK